MKAGWGERLRKERERLELTQSELGRYGGVRKQTQLNYENEMPGRSRPTVNYWQGISEAGVDILYVITGRCHQSRESKVG